MPLTTSIQHHSGNPGYCGKTMKENKKYTCWDREEGRNKTLYLQMVKIFYAQISENQTKEPWNKQSVTTRLHDTRLIHKSQLLSYVPAMKIGV